MNPRDWKFPMACDVCGSTDGTPFRVTSDTATLTVHVRCHRCRTEWAIVGSVPSMFKTEERPFDRPLVTATSSALVRRSLYGATQKH